MMHLGGMNDPLLTRADELQHENDTLRTENRSLLERCERLRAEMRELISKRRRLIRPARLWARRIAALRPRKIRSRPDRSHEGRSPAHLAWWPRRAPVRRAKGDVMAFLPRIVLMAYIAILVSVAAGLDTWPILPD